jgi:hypothetical protein
MSYAEIKPEYYRMHQPDSPWHAGSEGWKDAPWPGWGQNPNLVGPPRLAVEGLGAYYAPVYEKPISGLGSGCGCGAASSDTSASDAAANKLSGALLIGLGAAVIIGGFIFLGPKKMTANASRKKRSKKRLASPPKKSGGRAAKTYAREAGFVRRDLKAGYYDPSFIDEVLRTQYDKDEGEYRREGIKSAAQFVKGVRGKLGKVA